jgi:hypothetical protein
MTLIKSAFLFQNKINTNKMAAMMNMMRSNTVSCELTNKDGKLEKVASTELKRIAIKRLLAI